MICLNYRQVFIICLIRFSSGVSVPSFIQDFHRSFSLLNIFAIQQASHHHRSYSFTFFTWLSSLQGFDLFWSSARSYHISLNCIQFGISSRLSSLILRFLIPLHSSSFIRFLYFAGGFIFQGLYIWSKYYLQGLILSNRFSLSFQQSLHDFISILCTIHHQASISLPLFCRIINTIWLVLILSSFQRIFILNRLLYLQHYHSSLSSFICSKYFHCLSSIFTHYLITICLHCIPSILRCFSTIFYRRSYFFHHQ